jgi:hypothetical protein
MDLELSPTPGFSGTVDSTGGLSRVFLDLLILRRLQAHFVELFISIELARFESKTDAVLVNNKTLGDADWQAVCLSVTRHASTDS